MAYWLLPQMSEGTPYLRYTIFNLSEKDPADRIVVVDSLLLILFY